ncbi:MAG TPA: GAF domain-containing protein [Anaerolineae bacterium]
MNPLLPFDRDELLKRNAHRVAILFLITAILVTPFYVYLALQTGAWQLFTLAGGVLTLDVATAVSVVLIRRDQVTRGVGFMVGAILVLLFIASALISGLGVAAGFIAVIVTLAIVTQTLPPQAINRALLFSVIAAVCAGFLDLLAPSFQFVVPGIRTFTLVVAALLVLVFSIVIARQFRAYHLSTRLIIVFLAFTLVPIGLLAVLNNQATRALLIQDANQKLLAAATQTAGDFDTFIETNLNLVQAEAQLPIFTTYLTLPAGQRAGSAAETQVLATLQTLVSKDRSNIYSYALVDSEGKIAISTSSADAGTDSSGESYFQVPFTQKQPYVSPILFLPEPGDPALFFSSPVATSSPNAGGDALGVLLVRYNAAALQQLISQNNGLAGPDSFAVLFDENYAHLAHGTAPETAFTLITPVESSRIAQMQAQGRLPNRPADDLVMALPVLAENLATADTSSYFTAEDVATGDRLNQVAAVRMSTQPWLVAFFQPQDVFLGPITRQTQLTIVLSVIVAGVVAAGAIGVSQRMTAPIVHLTQVATKVTRGDLTAQALVATSDEIGSLAATFNTMTAQIRDLINTLEQRVADRTHALATSTQVSHRLSTILDQQQLVKEVVEQVRTAFDYYHVHIYLFDENNQNLIMAGGTGEAGRAMLAAGHKLATGKGLVGRAGASNTVVLAPDVSREPAWLPNPLLPHTKAEAAVPITVGKRVLGVLDVQHNVLNGLQQQDVDLLQSIANQVAVALRNAQLFTQVQQQSEELVLINRVVSSVAASMDLQQSMQIIATELAQAVGAEQTGIALMNPDGRSLTVVAEHFDKAKSASALGLVIPLEGNALTQQVITTRQPVIVADAQHNPLTALVHDIMRRRHVQTLILLPVIAGDAVIGTVGIDSLKENHGPTQWPSAEQLRLAETIIFQAATAVQNAHLFEQTQAALAETQRRSRELALINEVVSAVASLDLQTGLDTICSKLAQAVNVEQVRIALLNEDNTRLTVVAEHFDKTKSVSALGFVIPVAGNLLTQQVLETRQPVVVSDAQHNAITAPVHEGMRQQGIESLMVLPILAGNEVIGTVGIDILEKGRIPNTEELRLAETIVFQVATAVQNARLFEQTQATLAETEALYQASAQLNAAQSYNDVLSVLRQYTQPGQQAEFVQIARFDQAWTEEQMPSWINIIAYWSADGEGEFIPRYRLADIPSVTLLQPDKPTLVEDVLNDPRLDEAAREVIHRPAGIQSAIFLPLVVGKQWTGYIGFFYRQPMSFAEREVRHLMALAGQAAVTVQTIHLLEETNRSYQQEQARARREQVLREIAARVRGSADVDTIMRTAVQEIGQALGRRTFVYLGNKNNGEKDG